MSLETGRHGADTGDDGELPRPKVGERRVADRLGLGVLRFGNASERKEARVGVDRLARIIKSLGQSVDAQSAADAAWLRGGRRAADRSS